MPRADSTDTTIARRSMLKGLAALPAIATPAVVFAADHPDADLLRLGREFDALAEQEHIASAEAYRLYEICQDQLDATRPDALRSSRTDIDLIGFMPGREHGEHWFDLDHVQALAKMQPIGRRIKVTAGDNVPADLVGSTVFIPDPAGEARAEEIRQAWFSHYHGPSAQAVEDATGFSAATKRAGALNDAMQPLVDAILAAPAKTVEGLAVKVRVALEFPVEGLPDHLAQSGNLDVDCVASVFRAVLEAAEATV